jgi:hypothetical protein
MNYVLDALLVVQHGPMKIFAHIAFIIALGSPAVPQQNTRDYFQHLVGRLLILRHYGGSANSGSKEKDLSRKRGGCDEAVKVTAITFAASSIQLELKNIGRPSIGNKGKGCETSPDEYSLRITEFAWDQPSRLLKKSEIL